MISDVNNRIIDVNPAFTRISGYGKDGVPGLNPSILSSGQHCQQFYRNMWRSIIEKGLWRGEIWNRRKGGEEYSGLLSITRIGLDAPDQWHHMAVFSDLTVLKNHAAELDREANYPAASASAPGLAWCWPSRQTYCCWMSPPPIWILPTRSSCWS